MRSQSRSKSKSKSRSKSLPLTLHTGVCDEQATPLKTYRPKSTSEKRTPGHARVFIPGGVDLKPSLVTCDEKCLRRSPRLSGSEINGNGEMSIVKSLRRSPRLISSPVGPKNGSVKSILRNNAKAKSVKKFDSEEVLSVNGEMSVAKNLRRSPRLILSPLSPQNGNVKSSWRHNANVNSVNFDLEELHSVRQLPRFIKSPILAEKGSRKRILSELVDWSDRRYSKKVKSSLGASDLGILEEMSVRRSPRFTSSVISTKSCKSEDHALIKRQRSKGHNMELISNEVEEIVSSLECSKKNYFRRSSRLSSTKFGTIIDSSKSTRNMIGRKNLESLEEGSFKTLSLRVSDLKMRPPRKLSTEPLSLSHHENGDMDHVPLTCYDPRFSGSTNSISSPTKLMVENCLEQSPIIAMAFCGYHNGKIDCTSVEMPESIEKCSPPKKEISTSIQKKKKKSEITSSFVGDPIPIDEARERWRWRYELKDLQSQRCKGQSSILNPDDEDHIVVNVEYHYAQAKVLMSILNLGDCVYVKGEGRQKHVGKILEFFKTTDGENYFRVQWFYRAEDTVIKEQDDIHDKNRLFYSIVMNDNLLDCIISKVSVTQITPRVDRKSISLPPSDFYFDMEYCVEYSTFRALLTDNLLMNHDSLSPNCIETIPTVAATTPSKNMTGCEMYKEDLELLDLYAGCGGMSTGLCLGAKTTGVNLVTRWALDSDRSACESLKLNHPETHVRNEAAEDFLELLKEWEKLCRCYGVNCVERTQQLRSISPKVDKSKIDSLDADDTTDSEYEVSSLVGICYGDPSKTGKRGLYFRVQWMGYDTSEDTWEPLEGLRNCQEKIKDFVRYGLKSKILPLPGNVDVICGGPPCQGISGYNRYRNVDSPLADDRNRQIIVFMDIVQFLKPKFVLMENVVDILRFDKGSLGRYALSRLVHMKYQARLGTIAAGCYGLPQFRLRVFLWGAHPCEKLPKFPLPTHDVIVRYWPPPEFERNTVAYDEDQPRDLDKALVLQDAISDLPAVSNHDICDEMAYEKPPETEFQRYIRSTKYEMTGSGFSSTEETNISLHDHRPYPMHEDDYLRVCQIPKRKGANFRDLPGVVVGPDNVARRDPKNEPMLPSGKPLLPVSVFSFEQGKSKRPYGRLWWDETVPTVVTFPNHYSQVALHPDQDRVLTVREYARLQGFPDYYRFCGTVKERYCQVGNAVAVPVSRALGYALGMSVRKLGGDEPFLTLPSKFSHSTYIQLTDPLSDHSNPS